ncbi:thermonuclease family protein [Terrilactibacillus laevilacticus]|uniref:thermonuclease family protein n=1 Tax=Terrilactibacillus laevilacticus TaxID=1380157 RepID=UPI001FE71310|nr:thermonuclease family protein [Terrilactibacillus laevilacticus]
MNKRMTLYLKNLILILSMITIGLLTGCSSLLTDTANQGSDRISATVVKIVDGDTIHVKIKGKDEIVRMLLIDTPETHAPGKPVQVYGPEASQFAEKELPVGSHIQIEEGVKGHERDKYDRLLGYIYLENGDMYNAKVVEKGLARVGYIYPPNTKHLDMLKEKQADAEKAHLGIWSIPGYATSSGYDMNKAKTHNTSSSISASTNKSSSQQSGGSCKIKGNISSSGDKIYHQPGDPSYSQTKPEQLFCSVSEAKKAGFRAPKR